MLIRFRRNVAQYPRLFCVWIILYALTMIAAYAISRMAGIDTRHTLSAIGLAAILTALVDGALYVYVMSNPTRSAVFFAIINQFEGRENVAVSEFDEETGDEDEEEEVD